MAQNHQIEPHLVIGLIGPVGTDLAAIIDELTISLRRFNYETTQIRLSEMLTDIFDFSHPQDIPEDERINAFMSAGDKLRGTLEDGAAMATLAALRIRLEHIKDQSSNSPSKTRKAYIINSLKHPDEIRLLKTIYQDHFISLSIYQVRHIRQNRLIKRIKDMSNNLDLADLTAKAKNLIDRDEHTKDNPLGQNIRHTFSQGDIFINEDPPEKVRNSVNRALDIIFQSPYRTPSKDEFAMFYSRAASLKSADLSRQVGAVIVNDDGDILATGCNEVPKAGGGIYWENDKNDSRDFKQGNDANTLSKNDLLKEILEDLKSSKWLAKEFADMSCDDLLSAAKNTPIPMFKGEQVSSILEFSRAVHAEMNAILDAARRSIPVKNTTLYTTTFPCHMCASHIIGAGIKRVVYIEPYPKSKAKELFGGALIIENKPEDAQSNAVICEPFQGISPNCFIEFFTKGRRKTLEGGIIDWNEKNATPLGHYNLQSVLDMTVTLGSALLSTPLFTKCRERPEFQQSPLSHALESAEVEFNQWSANRQNSMRLTHISPLK